MRRLKALFWLCVHLPFLPIFLLAIVLYALFGSAIWFFLGHKALIEFTDVIVERTCIAEFFERLWELFGELYDPAP